MSEDNSRRTGRPKAEKPLEHDCKCRFNTEQLIRLDEYSVRHGIKRAQAIRAAVLEMLDRDAENGSK